jgi:chaperonin GroES
MKPLGENILVRPDKPPKQTASGIFIKESWESRPPIGLVEEIGPNVTEVKKGQRVVFMRYGSIATPDEDLRLIRQSHVLATIND